MHNKSFLAPLAMLISIGAWFLWNILLAAIYNNNKIYFVKSGFFSKFGKNPLWWLTLILILFSVVAFELAVISLRVAYWKTDEDTFQELEQDLGVRMRFEEASADLLANGWEGAGAMKERLIADKLRKEEEKRRKDEEQVERELEVGKLLRNRPSGLERMDGLERLASGEVGVASVDGGALRADIGERRSAVLVQESNEEAVQKSGDVLDTLNRLKGRIGEKGG